MLLCSACVSEAIAYNKASTTNRVAHKSPHQLMIQDDVNMGFPCCICPLLSGYICPLILFYICHLDFGYILPLFSFRLHLSTVFGYICPLSYRLHLSIVSWLHLSTVLSATSVHCLVGWMCPLICLLCLSTVLQLHLSAVLLAKSVHCLAVHICPPSMDYICPLFCHTFPDFHAIY